MRISNTIRSLGTLVLAAAISVSLVPSASADVVQPPPSAYPQWGQTLDGAALSSAIDAQAGKNLVDPSKPAYPKEGMLTTKADNAQAVDPAAFEGSTRTQGWFGKTWYKDPGQKCDPYNLVLQRDLVDVKLDSDGCTVLSGSLIDPFTSQHQSIKFTNAGQEDRRTVRVVQVVGFGYAYAHGAWAMGPNARLNLANDPLNLVAVPGYLADKDQHPGAGLFTEPGLDSGTVLLPVYGNGWLPEQSSGAQQAWAARFATVMLKYGITIEPESKGKLGALLQGWPGKVDTSPAGEQKIASARFVEQVPGVVVPTASPSQSATASQSATVPPPTTSGPSQSSEKNQGSSTPLLLVLALFAITACAVIGVFVYRSRDKRGGSRAG